MSKKQEKNAEFEDELVEFRKNISKHYKEKIEEKILEKCKRIKEEVTFKPSKNIESNFGR